MVDAGRTTGGEGAQCVFGPCVCEMCVFRYRQHSSRDKTPPRAPRPLHPHPPQVSPPTMLTQVCVLVCVCVSWASVFTLDGGLRALYRGTCRGQQEKDSCVRERKQKT